VKWISSQVGADACDTTVSMRPEATAPAPASMIAKGMERPRQQRRGLLVLCPLLKPTHQQACPPVQESVADKNRLGDHLCLSSHQLSDRPPGGRRLTSGRRHTILTTARRPGSECAPESLSGMAIAVRQAIAAHPCAVPAADWSSTTLSSVATAARITFRTCAACARPVTTVATAGGVGGSKSLRILGVRPAMGRARISAKFHKHFLLSGEGDGEGGGVKKRIEANVHF
jgi:hypothetical protein